MTGKQPPITIDQIDPTILKNIEYLIVDKITLDSNMLIKQTLPSTIIDVSNIDISNKNLADSDQNFESQVKVVRAGALPIKELEKYYG